MVLDLAWDACACRTGGFAGERVSPTRRRHHLRNVPLHGPSRTRHIQQIVLDGGDVGDPADVHIARAKPRARGHFGFGILRSGAMVDAGSRGFLATTFSVVLIDQSVPPTIRALDAWRGAEGVPDTDPLWLDDQGMFVEITSLGGNEIAGLTFVERDEDGAVQSIRWAEQAEYTEEGWRLSGVTEQRFDGADVPPALLWETEQTPEALQMLGAEPIDLAVSDLQRLARLRGSGSRPSAAYTAALLNRLTQPFKALVYLFVAAAIMQQPGRGASGDMAMVYGAAVGFLFLVLDGTLMTMAQSGFMNPWIATLSPMGILGFFGVLLWLRQEVTE